MLLKELRLMLVTSSLVQACEKSLKSLQSRYKRCKRLKSKGLNVMIILSLSLFNYLWSLNEESVGLFLKIMKSVKLRSE